MEELWLCEESARCIHPGWPILHGWDNIRETWKSIFDSGELLGVEASDIDIELVGNVAWITCIEKVSHRAGDKIYESLAQATNMFERHKGDWRMVLHHSSPIPSPQVDPETLQ